ncbi:sigma-70 family RNA polymerase sigma factor [Cohnella sp. CFH 77786]|uniref:RNA polymerase sigma factor n=1 Tax=Cohnella sp. CFH 77786 TaxID=2662265 RepID=UPI001C60D8E3|nr:sigma-70 family RNA polymerase sigma factor [Cohnella sp. CFH 77786]MBW5446918.1 sigma-70 family RNA polymerase sigma factor [Cohnella sp. CFH 77786]
MSILRNSEVPAAFSSEEAVLAEMYRQMLKVARRKLYDKSEAGDIVQEAWVRILERQSSLREADKLIPWAKSIAFNLASNANRANKAQSVYDSYARYLSDSVPSPELIAELSDLLGRLDPTTRTLLLYKFYYGFKDDEIAAVMDVPVGTVKARIHRSKARLQQAEREERRASNGDANRTFAT